MKRVLFILSIVLLLIGCDSNSKLMENEDLSPKTLLEQIKEQEDKINELSKDLRPGMKIPSEMNEKLIHLLIEFYHKFPKNKYAPVCLDKLHMIYSAKREYQTSADYGDTLLNNYPNYINRPMILESMATTYDIFIQPRDTSKVRYYNELLLEEDKEMPQEKREEIIFRLNHLDLSLEEMILEINK